jgi:integrase
MRTLGRHLEDYLKLRRRLGFQLRVQGILLRSFVRFAGRQRASRLTTKLALRWATLPCNITQRQRAHRLGVVRQFAQYVSAIEPRTEVPAPKLIPWQFHRHEPFHYTDQEILRLMDAGRQIAPSHKIKGLTLGSLLGLLAVTGLRVGEALALDRGDVDFGNALLTIRRAKGNKSRLVALHPSAVRSLQGYAHSRDKIYPQPISPGFFLWKGGSRLAHSVAYHWFVVAACQAGLWKTNDGHRPRLHDLRHYFAIRTLLNWYRCGADVEAHLPELATFLGHVHVRDTYWYLSAVPELLKLATLRWERAEKGGK